MKKKHKERKKLLLQFLGWFLILNFAPSLVAVMETVRPRFPEVSDKFYLLCSGYLEGWGINGIVIAAILFCCLITFLINYDE